jgi:sugar lactone lactonase YvrE
VGEALDVTGMQEVQLPTPADSSCCFCKAERETVALFQIQGGKLALFNPSMRLQNEVKICKQYI